MPLEHFDFAVIGSGPAGFRAALTAARMGKKVAIADRKEMFGGVALRTGGIPSKALREAALHLSGFQQRLFYDKDSPVKPQLNRQQLADRVREVVRRQVAAAEVRLQGHDITFLPGTARFHDSHVLDIETQEGVTQISADFVLIACGTRPSIHPGIPVDHDRILNADSVAGRDFKGEVSKTVVVVGAGPIGLEYASVASVLGMAVAIIDSREEVLPSVDREIAARLLEHHRSLAIEFLLGERIESAIAGEHNVVVRLESGKQVQCDRLLYAGPRVSNTDQLNLEAIGLPVNEHGQIRVDGHFQTAIPHIYAAGDVVGFPALASVSVEQGRVAASHMFGEACTYDINLLPLGIYTIPEIAMVGRTEEKLAEEGIPYGVGVAKFSELARGQLIGDDKGMLKLLFEPDRHTLLGVHVIGTNASEILHIGHMAMMLGGTMDFLRDAVFNFPTMAEAYKAAADNGLSRLSNTWGG